MSKQKTNEGLFSASKRFSDAFFDGLKNNATNKAITVAKKNKLVPTKIVSKMLAIEKASEELEKMIRDLEK